MPAKVNKTFKVKLKQLIDPALARSLAHPIRGHILVRLGELGSLSASQVARELGVKASDLSYHFRSLRAKGLIDQVHLVQRRGFTERVYKLADPVMHFDDREWGRIPQRVRKRLGVELLKSIFEEAVQALNAGTVSAERSHMSRVWVVADERGQDELIDFERRILKERMALKRKIERRTENASAEVLPMTLVSMCFQRPPEGTVPESSPGA
jgi:DNA-binding transcriptional ArsR family regulator